MAKLYENKIVNIKIYRILSFPEIFTLKARKGKKD